MITSKIRKLIENNPLSVATTDGKNPNLAFVAFAKVLDDSHIIFTDNYLGKTRENIRGNGKIYLGTYDKDWNGVKISGTAKYYESGKYFDLVKNQAENSGENPHGAIVVVVKKVVEIG